MILTRYDNVGALAEMEAQATKGESRVIEYPRLWGNFGTPNYGYTFEGYLHVPETALWNLLVQADNEAIVTVDDFTFGDQPGRGGWGLARVNLEKGFHHVKIGLKC